MITYETLGPRKSFTATNSKLIDCIEAGDLDKISDVKDIIVSSLSLTSQQLNFTAAKNDNDPNKLIDLKAAHCVGYATFFSTTCNYLLKKHQLAESWVATPQIGQLFFMGMNVHQYINTPFFKDHDFVIIENKLTHETLAVDPTVNDYLLIDYVSYRK